MTSDIYDGSGYVGHTGGGQVDGIHDLGPLITPLPDLPIEFGPDETAEEMLERWKREAEAAAREEAENEEKRNPGYTTQDSKAGGKCKKGAGEGETKPPSLTPEGAGRQGAINEAKRRNGVPTSAAPDEVLPNTDNLGNTQPGRTYVYTDTEGNSVRIRDDAAGHQYADDPTQNRGSHFNDEKGNHYDY